MPKAWLIVGYEVLTSKRHYPSFIQKAMIMVTLCHCITRKVQYVSVRTGYWCGLGSAGP
jgi:hypothetical protein